ncbi:MAG: hypothetical protein IKU41_03120 [Clostridia bacterium]|nr:hypothetical protein [Clostridia bacterium]
MSKLIANVDDYDIEEIEKKMELMSSECASRFGEPETYVGKPLTKEELKKLPIPR